MTLNCSIARRARALVVDDDLTICEIVRDALEHLGFEVLIADNVPDALFLLTSAGRIDVLFTDVNLPGDMGGNALAQLARSMRPDLPIVCTSGRRPQACSLRPDQHTVFVPKPFDPHAVGSMLDALINLKTASA